MNFYIELVDGQPVNHPIAEDNLIQAFPHLDLANLPANFAKFKRIEKPVIGIYEVYEGVLYKWENGVFQDSYQIRNMTDKEVLEKQNQVKSDWESIGFASWIFNEETCWFDPPIPYPNDGNAYIWNEDLQTWDLAN